MAEVLTFMDSFDHTPLAWAGKKITTVQGTATLVAGPYHGDAVRFSGGGNGYWPALTGQNGFYVAPNPFWDSGGWGANVRVSASGFGSAYVVLLQCAWFDQVGEGFTDFHHHELRLFSDGHLACYVMPLSGGVGAMTLIPGSASAAGAFPFDQWVALEYRTTTRLSATGSVAARVDETEVLSATGVITCSQERALVTARYFRFGNLRSNGNTVTVDVDDVAARGETTLGAAALPWWGRHRVACVLPTGPGDSAGHGLVGAAANWAACADLPATPATADTSYVTKAAGVRPVDLYATAALPAYVPAEGAGAFLWGFARDAGGDGRVTMRAQDGLGGAWINRDWLSDSGSGGPHFRQSNVGTSVLTGLADDQLEGLQAGWGLATGGTTTTGEVYEATHLAVELWYRPAEVEPPPTGGGQRWAATWVG